MPSTANTEHQGGVVVTSERQPFVAMGAAVLERLSMPGTNDAGLLKSLGQAAVGVYYLRTVAHEDESAGLKRHLSGVPEPEDIDVVDRVSGTAWLINNSMAAKYRPRNPAEALEMLMANGKHLMGVAAAKLSGVHTQQSLAGAINEIIQAGELDSVAEPDSTEKEDDAQADMPESPGSGDVEPAEVASELAEPSVLVFQLERIGRVPKAARAKKAGGRGAKGASHKPAAKTGKVSGPPKLALVKTEPPTPPKVETEDADDDITEAPAIVIPPDSGSVYKHHAMHVTAEVTAHVDERVMAGLDIRSSFEGLMIILSTYKNEREAILAHLSSASSRGERVNPTLTRNALHRVSNLFIDYLKKLGQAARDTPDYAVGFTVAACLFGDSGPLSNMQEALAETAAKRGVSPNVAHAAFSRLSREVLAFTLKRDPASSRDVWERIAQLRSLGALSA